jgi:tetratricopeptide (TPR) repeat protein
MTNSVEYVGTNSSPNLKSHRAFVLYIRRTPELWIFLAVLVVRILILNRFAASPYFLPASDDMKFYADWAMRISDGHWTDGAAFYGLPGYAFCLAGFFQFFGFSPFLIGLVQVVLEATTTVFIFRIAKESFSFSQNGEKTTNRNVDSTAIGALAAVAWIFYLPAQAFSTVLMPNAWLLAAFWGCVWLLIRRSVTPQTWVWFGFGLGIGFVAMMVATVLFLLPLFLFAIVQRVGHFAHWRLHCAQAVRAVALLLVGTLIGMSPAWLHNCLIANDPVLLSAHSGLNYYMGNNQDATGYPKIPDGLSAGQEGLLRDSITWAEKAAGRSLKRSEVSRYWSARANAWIRENPNACLALLGVKLRNFWNSFQYDDVSEIRLLRDEGVLPPGLSFGLIGAFGLPGMLLAGWRFAQTRWIAAAVLMHMCALLLVFITERYRLCAVPGLTIFAAFVVWEIWRALSCRMWRAFGCTIAVVGVAMVFVSWPQRNPGLWALDPFNTGLKVLRAGDLAGAERKLNVAHRLVPENPEINFGLGNLWFEKKDFGCARRFYRRTVKLAPRHVGALNNLGRLEALEHRWDEAEKWLGSSIAIDPASLKPHFILAELRYSRGDFDGSRTALTSALALAPKRRELLELQQKLKAAQAP